MLSDKKIIHVSAWAKAFTQFKWPQVVQHKNEFGRVVLYCSDDPPHVARLKKAGFEVVLTPMSKKPDPGVPLQIARLYAYLRKEKFDVLYAHQSMGGLIGVTAAKLARVPVIFYSTGGIRYQPERKDLFNRLVKYGEFKISEWSDAAFVNNREDEAMMLADPRTRDRVRYVGPRGGCGVDTGMFNPEARIAQRGKVRHDLGIDDGTTVVGCVSRLVWYKGFRELIDGAAILKEEHPGLRLRFMVLGDGGDAEAIEDYAKEKGVGEAFSFMGYKFDVAYYMSAFDVVTLISYKEGLPVALLQALAMGIPGIATRVKGNRELIEDGVSGLLVPAGDPRAYADALLRMASDTDAAARMGEEASRNVAENYGEDVLVARLLDMTRDVIDGKCPDGGP